MEKIEKSDFILFPYNASFISTDNTQLSKMDLNVLEMLCKLANDRVSLKKEDTDKIISIIMEHVNYMNINEIITNNFIEIMYTVLKLLTNEQIEEITFMSVSNIMALLSFHNSSLIHTLIVQNYPTPIEVITYAIEKGHIDIIRTLHFNGKLPNNILNIAEAYGHEECIEFLRKANYKSD